jgi:putative hydrolase of the HAD superfamily
MHWEESPLAPLFDEAVFSCNVHLIKPDPEIYLLAARLVNCPPQACVFIGDGGSDELMGARRAGMRTIQVRYFAQREVEGADCVVERFEDILSLDFAS